MPARRATSGDGWASGAGKRRRGPLGGPVVMLALYSIAGIALIVLAVNLLSRSLGGGGAPQPVPAADRRPAADAAPVPTAAATPAVSDFELARRERAAAAAREAAIASAARAERRRRLRKRRRQRL